MAHDNGPEPDALDDAAPPDAAAPVVTRRGDLWQLAPHRVLCADATQPEAYARLLEGEQAQMTFADVPYNLPIGGHVSGLGRAQHAEFPMASGELSEDKYTALLTTAFAHIRSNSADGAIAYVCMDWRHLRELLAAGDAESSEPARLNEAPLPPRTTKQEQVLTLLSGPAGASIEDLMTATDWQKHSVRGFLAGTVKRKLGFNLTSSKAKGDVRRYRIQSRRGR